MWHRRRTMDDGRQKTIDNQSQIDGQPSIVHRPTTALLRRLHWTTQRALASALGGSERSMVLGPGMELDEVREYQPGDDVRLIDWNITARTGHPFVRQARVERALDVWLLLDVSPSLSWGTAQALKGDRLLELAAVAGQVLGQHGNRMGTLLFADQPLSFLPPAAGRTHMLRLLAGVRAAPTQTRQAATDLQAALARAGAVMKRRSLIVLVSDFLVPDGWQQPLRRLAQRHEVVAVQLYDPRERALPDVGLITLEDPETGQQLLVNTSDQRLRADFERAAAEQAAHLRHDLARSGADQFAISTAEELVPALVRYLHTRRQRRAGRG